MIDVLLGKIHISGPLAWGPMERANYIHGTYMRAKKEKISELVFDSAAVAAVSNILQLPQKEIVRNLTIYSVFNQLQKSYEGVGPEKFTLIELATSSSKLKSDYFELHPETLRLSGPGAERFYELCLRQGCQIVNPTLFKKLNFIHAHGNHQDLIDIETGQETILNVEARVKTARKATDVARQLQAVREELEKVNLANFNGTQQEEEEIRKSVTLFLKSLFR